MEPPPRTNFSATANQVRPWASLKAMLPTPPSMLSNKEDWYSQRSSGSLPSPSICFPPLYLCSEHLVHETVGPHPVSSGLATCPPHALPGMASQSSSKTRGEHLFPWTLCSPLHPVADSGVNTLTLPFQQPSVFL